MNRSKLKGKYEHLDLRVGSLVTILVIRNGIQIVYVLDSLGSVPFMEMITILGEFIGFCGVECQHLGAVFQKRFCH
jgi:hypothetical protein